MLTRPQTANDADRTGSIARPLLSLAVAVLALWPAESRAQTAPAPKTSATATDTGYAEVDGVRIYYQVHGELAAGKLPLLVLHGSYMTAEFFAGTPMEADYMRLSPTPDAFPTLVEKLKALDAAPQAWPEEEIRAIQGKTMIVIGDADGVRLEHAVEMFKLRGGGDPAAAAQGFLTEPPRARLAILPGTSHIGIMANAELIGALVTPFLDDAIPPMPEGFF